MHPRLAFSAALLITSICGAGVVVEVNGTQHSTSVSNSTYVVTFSAGATPDIEIQFFSQVTAVFTVRIFDDNTVTTSANPNGQPQVGVGRIKVIGSASSTGRLNLLVADADQLFPTDPFALTSLRPGLTTLGGTLTTGASSSGAYSHDYDAAPWATSNIVPSYGPQPFTDWGNADLKGIIIPRPLAAAADGACGGSE